MSAKDDSASPAVEADLDDRKAAILRAIVEQYVADARSRSAPQTVDPHRRTSASRRRPSATRCRCSSARATSRSRTPRRAGSRPTAATATTSTTSPVSARSPAPERRRIAEFFTTATMAMDELLLADEPAARPRHRHAAVVVGPQSEAVVVRGAHLVLLQPRVAARRRHPVERRGREGGRRTSTTTSTRPTSRPRAPASPGTSTAAASPTSRSRRHRDDGPTTTRRRSARRAASRRRLRTHVDAHQPEPLYVGGASRLAAEQEAFTGRRSPRLLELLEQHVVLVVAAARAARARAHRAHRFRERARRPAASARSCSRRTSSRASWPVPSACSARRGWTTARRRPPSRPSRNSSDASSPGDAMIHA